jgi:16S rRNA (uracil1498-N3)-methyltransferase
MRTIRALLPEATASGQTIELPPAVFQHLVKVLRLSAGADLQLFNGIGQRFSAQLIDVGKKSANVEIIEELTSMTESPLQTHMGLVMSKGDRFDYALQKATELGVTHITPLTSERCDLKLKADRIEKKMQHWQGVIASACEQCYRDVVPTLAPIQSLSQWTSEQSSDVKLVLHTATTQPEWQTAAPSSVSFLIGPEGGLTDEEVKHSKAQGFDAWQLGPRILRTETAPVVILSLLQQRWGDF